MSLAPIPVQDELVHDAATRAFGNLAQKGGDLLGAVKQLGFADALPDHEAWPQAATIIRAQARAAAPVDMAELLSGGDAAALSLGRLLQICAGMEAALELSLKYVQDRKQFGRALAQFQAIQHQLAIAAEEIAACGAATDLVLACAAREGHASPRLPALLDGATLVAGRAVDVVYENCHQVHGAIGFTQEYALHRHSLDLLRWRAELQKLRGGELACAERLGDWALASGSLWRGVVSAMSPGGTHG
jgi:acyl-CoA dehydrogenase